MKNVVGLPRPVPYEIDLQENAGFVERVTGFGFDPIVASTITVKLGYSILFTIVLLALLWIAMIRPCATHSNAFSSISL